MPRFSTYWSSTGDHELNEHNIVIAQLPLCHFNSQPHVTYIDYMRYYMKMTGTDIHTVQELVESHLKDMILKHFDTKKADAIFADGEVS